MTSRKTGTIQETEVPVILFDGVCNLCNGLVDRIIRCMKSARFRYITLQSETGKTLMKEHAVSCEADSIVFIENGEVYLRSSAVLQILRKLGGAWSLLYGLNIVPLFFRDGVYDFIARRRYGWFGKRNRCRIIVDRSD